MSMDFVVNVVGAEGTWEQVQAAVERALTDLIETVEAAEVIVSIVFTEADQARLESLEKEFDAKGGPGVLLAEEIDHLHAKRDAAGG